MRQIPAEVLETMDAEREDKARTAWIERDSNAPGGPRIRPDAVPNGLPAEIFERMLGDRLERRMESMARAHDPGAPRPEPRIPGKPPPPANALKMEAMAMYGIYGAEAVRKLLHDDQPAQVPQPRAPRRRDHRGRSPRPGRRVRRPAQPRGPDDDPDEPGEAPAPPAAVVDPVCADCGRQDLEVGWSVADALNLCLDCYAARGAR